MTIVQIAGTLLIVIGSVLFIFNRPTHIWDTRPDTTIIGLVLTFLGYLLFKYGG